MTDNRSKWRRRIPIMAGLLAGPIVYLLVWVLRINGVLQPVELLAYDGMLRLLPSDNRHSAEFLVVGLDRKDARDMGHYPMTDLEMAQLLRTLLKHEPCVIGVDIYRDLVVPPGRDELNQVLKDHQNVIFIYKSGNENIAVNPPEELKGSDRTGFGDHCVDPDGVVRRSLIYMDISGKTQISFAMQIASHYLSSYKIEASVDPLNERGILLGNARLAPIGTNHGGYVGLDAAGFQIMLDYRGPRRIDFASVRDVMSGKVTPERIRGKILLLGITDPTMKDYFATPFNPEMPGVELQAIETEQIVRAGLDGATSTQTLTEPMEAIWILLCAISGALIQMRDRSVRIVTSAGTYVVGILLIAVICLWALFQALWIPLVPALLAFVASAVVSNYTTSYYDRQDRRSLMYLFRRHVAAQVAETIWENRYYILENGRLPSRRQTVTVMFADIIGFTPISESMKPPALFDWLNVIMECIAAPIDAHTGVINQFIGDEVMAVFGAPALAITDERIQLDARAAVEAALGIRKALAQLNAEWANTGLPTVGLRIGIYTGPVVTGAIGSRERQAYAVCGDTVNIASRLQNYRRELMDDSVARQGCRILIGAPTLKAIGEGFVTHGIGPLELKGKKQAIETFAVLGHLTDNLTRHGEAQCIAEKAIL